MLAIVSLELGVRYEGPARDTESFRGGQLGVQVQQLAKILKSLTFALVLRCEVVLATKLD